MKQQKIYLIVIASLIVTMSAIIWFRYNQIKPMARQGDNNTPIVVYDESTKNDSTRPTLTDESKEQADAPGNKTPTAVRSQPNAFSPTPVRTDNAPRQTAINKTVTKEYTYYPLLDANDPGYSSNWSIKKVSAPAAWDIATGNGQTVVAVIDTGFGLNHDDLKNSWHINTAEVGTTSLSDRCWIGLPQDKATNNCDDDSNGYLDDWRGWNFFLGDNNPMAGRTNPTGVGVSHGTEVSGLVGAAGNNNTGITTINWNTKIMPLQALSDDGPGYTSDIAAAIYYAVDNGADVINMSLGSNTFDAVMKTATDYAYVNGVTIIAAAGNCGSGSEQGCEGLPAGSMSYPALNDHVIAVGATTINDLRASFSSYGPGLDVVAPGSGTIASPTWTDTNQTSLYSGALYGTSYSSPQVASLAALIKSIRPSSSVDDISALLLATTTKLPNMNGLQYTDEFGHGMINASTAMSVATSLNTTTATPKLLQTGNHINEHNFAASDTMGSGCLSTSETYCTIWLRNSANGYERYLPYRQTSPSGSAGWSWSGELLTSGDWSIRAAQGDKRTTTYSVHDK